jgi:hypothetical protein
MKTIIAGSRSITNYDQILEAISLSNIIITTVISGTANGVDKLGERFAKDHDIPVLQFPADWDKYGKKAGYLRNIEMAEVGDALICVWDGQSHGSKHMIEIATRRGLKVYVHDISKPIKGNLINYME